MQHMTGTLGVQLFFKTFQSQNPVAKILICTGNNESHLKYEEVIQDLLKMSFSVFYYDHRGQGFSQRLQGQHRKGHIDKFDCLVDDFALMYQLFSKENPELPCFVLSHSMGCVVATLALAKYQFKPAGVVLCSPMFEINMWGLSWLEYPLLLLARLFVFLGYEKEFALGQKEYDPHPPFENNSVTHSRTRFEFWRKHLATNPILQLGGPTFGWIAQSVAASRKARKMGHKMTMPLLLLQAGQDSLVLLKPQNQFASQCPHAQLIHFKNARHELFMETDDIRNQVLGEINCFVMRHSEKESLL